MSENLIITQLTPQQEALIPVYREKWCQIAFSTERINKEKAAEAVKAAYKLIGKEEPKIIFIDSPYAATKSFYFDICDYYIDIFFALREKLTGNFCMLGYEAYDMDLFDIVRKLEFCILEEASELLSNSNARLCDEFYQGHMYFALALEAFIFCVSHQI